MVGANDGDRHVTVAHLVGALLNTGNSVCRVGCKIGNKCATPVHVLTERRMINGKVEVILAKSLPKQWRVQNDCIDQSTDRHNACTSIHRAIDLAEADHVVIRQQLAHLDEHLERQPREVCAGCVATVATLLPEAVSTQRFCGLS